MKWLAPLLMRLGLALLAVALSRPALAHRIDEYLQATLLSVTPHAVRASVRLIPGVRIAPEVIARIDTNGDGRFSTEEQEEYARLLLADLQITIERQPVTPQLLKAAFPPLEALQEGVGEIELGYALVLPSREAGAAYHLRIEHRGGLPKGVYLTNAVVPNTPGVRLLSQVRNPTQSVYELDFTTAVAGAAMGEASGVQTFGRGLLNPQLFRLGQEHIAEGTDHLLFLLALLLPAPLLAVGSRWGSPRRIGSSLLHMARIVTAFTVGHSITLAVAASIHRAWPSQPIEIMIAVSIIASALHALRPLFSGREAAIAAGFGLIHGMAFAATLDRLAVSGWERLGNIAAFNIGIETMQLLVVAAALPSLLLLSRTRAYRLFRIASASAAATAAAGWILQRAFSVPVGVDSLADSVTAHRWALAASLALSSVIVWSIPGARVRCGPELRAV